MTCLDDATVLGLIEGRLPPPQLATIDEHIDTCDSCRALVTAVATSRGSERVLERGHAIGRYVLGDLLGAGAMGRVYSAWEPELDRRVAVKILDEGGSRERVVREAQAMAKLNHPNVVTVHEVGSTSDGVYVAMELVDGATLRAWSKQPHGWREKARVLADVARGLAAVHAAGVVHRDLKPDNIIVGADGRARIGDFGLARSDGAGSDAKLVASTDTSPVGATASTVFARGTSPRKPRAGAATHEIDLDPAAPATAIAGTPVYMAPEVLRGSSASTASDQFSFGVTAYEVFAGERPFDGATWSELLRNVETAKPPPLRDAPGWLDDVIRRCMSLDPAKRYASMQVVADRIARGVARRNPALLIAGAVTAAALASVATRLALRDNHETRDCELALATLWTPNQRAFVDAHPAAKAALDRWVVHFADERGAVCRANLPPARTAARERCLDHRKAEITALLEQASTASTRSSGGQPAGAAASAPDRVIDALAVLPDPAECRDADLDTADPLPFEQSRAVAAKQVADQLPPLRATIALGDARVALDQAAVLVETARTSRHAPTLADALIVRAEALRGAGSLAEAAISARDAVAAAERGHANRIAALAWVTRVAIANDQRTLDLADELGTIAQAVLDRAGGAQPRQVSVAGAPQAATESKLSQLGATLLRIRGLVAYNRGDLDEARKLLTLSRAQFTALTGEHSVQVASIDSALGSVARAAGDLDEAERRHRAALALDRELRGANHPDIARDLHNVAGVLRLGGKLEDALATYREALAAEIAMQGEHSVAAGLTHNSIGLVLMETVQWREAREEVERADEILSRAGSGDRAFAAHNLGLIAQALGDQRAALQHFTRAASIYAATIGDRAAAPLRLLFDRARSELYLGDRESARTHAIAARAGAREADLPWLEQEANGLLAALEGALWDKHAPVPAGTEPTTLTISSPPASAPTPIPEPAKAGGSQLAKPPAHKPKPKKDVGVYGANQNF